MAKKPSNSNTNKAKRAAILKELESVKALLNEDLENLDKATQETESAVAAPEENHQEHQEEQQEFQIPLLDPGKSTTHELDFSSPKAEPIPIKPAPAKEPSPEDIPMIDDITASSSLFDDGDDEVENFEREKASKLTQAQLRDYAQLIIQDLLNDAITEIEDKLEEWIPKLEEKLKKRLEKAMEKHIEDSLNK